MYMYQEETKKPSRPVTVRDVVNVLRVFLTIVIFTVFIWGIYSVGYNAGHYDGYWDEAVEYNDGYTKNLFSKIGSAYDINGIKGKVCNIKIDVDTTYFSECIINQVK